MGKKHEKDYCIVDDGFLSLLTYFYWTRLKDKIREVTPMIDNETLSNLTLSVVYDNNEYDERLKTAWGFSCLVELGDKNILFDAGGDSPTLLDNLKRLGIDPKEFDIIVLSHIHGDHTGGLAGVLEANSNVTVYLPESFPKSFKAKTKSYGATYVEVGGPAKILGGAYTTGELGTWIKEESLILRTNKGLVVITGCAHPGIVNIVRKAKAITNEDVYLVFGGFHLGAASDADLRQVVNAFRELGVKKAGPCHCSGDRCRELFEEEYRDDFVDVGVGKIIKI
jgi:7,8-dihydropterin-6-yl-methyl-4-(beta-D-ribofuranosyl)aminobenzene 5'-phosphate synthase